MGKFTSVGLVQTVTNMEIKMDGINPTFTTLELWIAKVIHIPYCGYDGANQDPK